MMLEVADRLAHFLYEPTALGKLVHRKRWHHHIHLIPGWLARVFCNAYDRWLEANEGEPDRDA